MRNFLNDNEIPTAKLAYFGLMAKCEKLNGVELSNMFQLVGRLSIGICLAKGNIFGYFLLFCMGIVMPRKGAAIRPPVSAPAGMTRLKSSPTLRIMVLPPKESKSIDESSSGKI